MSLPDDVREEVQTVTRPLSVPYAKESKADRPLTPMIGFWKPYRYGVSPIRLRPVID